MVGNTLNGAVAGNALAGSAQGYRQGMARAVEDIDMIKSVYVLVSSVLLIGLAQTAGAEKVYGSVDEKGNVTYSDAVPAGAKKVEEIKVTPTRQPEPEVEASKARAEKAVKAAEKGQKSRDAANSAQQNSTSDARARVKSAEAGLRDAKEVKAGDRRGLAGGGSRLTPEYHQRVEAAERELKSANDALKGGQTRP